MTASPTLRPLVSVVIVSFNTRETTLRCLRDLQLDVERWGEPVEIFVVDNASHDGSPAAIRAEFPGVCLLESGVNEGFGPANNRAFERARGEFFFLLNSDAFVHEGALAKLVAFLQDPRHPSFGAVGPRLLNEDGTLQASCWKFPSPARAWAEALGVTRFFPFDSALGDYYRWAHDQTRAVDFVIGAALLVRREVYLDVGGFDPEFFLYAEETDWQKRMHEADWQIAFCTDAVVTHLGGASGASDAPKTSILFWQGQERFIRKHFGENGNRVYRAALFFAALTRVAAFTALTLHPRKRRAARGKIRFFGWQMGRLLRPPSEAKVK